MKILVIDTFGECALAWALRCQAAGHKVRWFISERKMPVGEGLVEIVKDWREHVAWADLVFTPDNLKYLRELDAWRKRDPKKPIIAPCVEGAAWETDRLLGMKVLRNAGIPILPFREFTDYDKAISYVQREGDAFVSKPCGDETDKALSYVSKSAADLVFMLERWKKLGKLKGSFILQEKVKGCEMGVGGWFGPGGFMDGWEENFEFKKLMPGDIGPNTGEMGTVMRYVRRSKLANKVLKPLGAALERIGYIGCVDVNVIIDEDGTPWPLEFTMRPGWPAFNIQQALTEGDPAEWLVGLNEGKTKAPWVYDQIAVGVVVAIPDFPYSKATKKEVVGFPIYGLDDVDAESIHLCQVMRGEAPYDMDGKIARGPALVSAGDYIMVATGVADTVHNARRKVYNTLGKISMPGSPFWRDDIGERLKEQLPVCQDHGFAEDMTY